MEQLLGELELAVRSCDQVRALGLLSRVQACVEQASVLAATVEIALAELGASSDPRDFRRFAECVRVGLEDWSGQR